jgi:hypothetical protein
LLADHHKQINSFGFGALEDLSFWTESRMKEDNPNFQSPVFPLMYVVPANVEQRLTHMVYQFNVIILDIIERDLSNQTDVLSDTNQILDDVISQFRLSVTNSLGNFNKQYYLQTPVTCNPFIEKYTDLCGGWSGLLNIEVIIPLNRCDAAFGSFETPTPTPTTTVTPTVTTTITPTSSETPTPTVTPTLTQTPTVTQTPTTSETPTQTPTPTVTETTTQTPTPTITPTETPNQCREYEFKTTDGPAYITYNDCYGNPQIWNQPFGTTENICAIAGTVILVSGFAIITNLGPCIPPTPTPTPTVTSTITPTVTETPTQTPTSSVTPTPTITPTITQTQTPTVTQTISSTPTNTPTPSVTPNPICLSQIEESGSSFSGFNGTYFYNTIGYFEASTNSFVSGVAPNGNSYVVYINALGNRIIIQRNGLQYIWLNQVVPPGLTNLLQTVSITDGTYYFPQSGPGSSGTYLTYPTICNPTPTPTITQSPSQTPTNTPTPSITPSSGSGGQLWNTNSTNWDSETGLWNTI